MVKQSDYRLLSHSAFFDAKWYLEQYPNVKKTGLDPIVHYLKYGWKEKLNPSQNFSGADYYAANPDVEKANINPLLHYLKYGIKEFREIAPRKSPVVPFEIITKSSENDVDANASHAPENISFSVIMPTYNRAGLIERAVDSLLAQTFQKFELIIVDDGSTDNTSELLQARYKNELAKGKIKYFRKENGGCCKARNYGLQHAIFPWIAYLDSDNEVYPHFLQTFADAILNNDNNCFYAQWDTQSGMPPFRSATFDFAALVRRNFIDLGVFIHAKSLYDELGGFDENLTRLVDWDLIIRYTKQNNPYYIEKSVLFYNDGNNHVRITNNGAYAENRDKIWNKYRPLVSVVVPVFQVSEEMVRDAIESLLSQTLKTCEFIFVDDGISPEIIDIIHEYKDDRIRIIKNKFHAGSKISYENGAFVALGKFTIFFDISKAYTADFCEQCYQKLLANSYQPEIPKEMPKVTTLVMTYNHEAYLAEALESVIKQRGDFENEVLILNDASTDNTQSIIDEYVKKYPNLFKDCSNGKNIGISANIKQGLSLATGKYIAILEGDDSWLSPVNLQEKISFLEQNKDCSCCFSKLQLYKEATKSTGFIEAQENFPAKLKARDWLPTTINPVTNFSSCVFLAHYLKNLPSAIYAYRFSEIPLCFWLEKTSYLGFINKPLTRYRINEGGVWSGASQIDKIKQMIEVRKIAYNLCDGKYKKVLKRELKSLSKKLIKISGKKGGFLKSLWDRIAEWYFNFKNDCALKKDCNRIRKSRLFDTKWYLSKNSDVLAAGVDPVKHYLCHGWREGREPGPLFCGKDYLSANLDVKRLKQNPLLHYIRFGQKEGRKIFPVEKGAVGTSSSTAWQKLRNMFNKIGFSFFFAKREQKLRLDIISYVQSLIAKEHAQVLKVKDVNEKKNAELLSYIKRELEILKRENNKLLIDNKKLQEDFKQAIQREQEARRAERVNQVNAIAALQERCKKLEENLKNAIQREQETRRAERVDQVNAIAALQKSCKGLKENFKQIILSNRENYRYIKFYWIEIFRDYFESHNMQQKVLDLKDGLDEISCDYVDRFMELSKYWDSYYYGEPYTSYDVKLQKECEAFNFVQPYPEISRFNAFIFSNKYGLADLPKAVFDQINGRDIVDGGGFNGDTPVLFSNLFPRSKVYVYEPLKYWMGKIQQIKNQGNLQNLMLVNKGLGDKEMQAEIDFHVTEMCEITTLDMDYAGDNLGLIKLDTEGFETNILTGATQLIKKYKPVLVIAIYHTPQDFFDLKDRIKRLNPNYKFMIRRSEQVIPTADLVLIAY